LKSVSLTAADVGAEELRGKVRDLVSLIEDYGVGAAEQVAEAVLLQCQVGEQQVMIDDDDVGLEGLAPRRHHVTARDLRAAHRKAALARRGHLRPDRVCVGEAAHLGEVAALRGGRPAPDTPQHRL